MKQQMLSNSTTILSNSVKGNIAAAYFSFILYQSLDTYAPSPYPRILVLWRRTFIQKKKARGKEARKQHNHHATEDMGSSPLLRFLVDGRSSPSLSSFSSPLLLLGDPQPRLARDSGEQSQLAGCSIGRSACSSQEVAQPTKDQIGQVPVAATHLPKELVAAMLLLCSSGSSGGATRADQTKQRVDLGPQKRGQLELRRVAKLAALARGVVTPKGDAAHAR